MYLEELHDGNTVKEKIESLLLRMDAVILTTVQLGSDGCSRKIWSRLNEAHYLSSTLLPELG